MTLATIEDAPFAQGDEAAWRALVDKALKGADFDSLVTTGEDGFAYGPIHARRPDARPLARAASGPWTILQALDDPDPARANAQALNDLANGATGLALAFAGAPAARGYGLPCDADAVAGALDGVELSAVALRLEPCPDTDAALAALAGVAARRTATPAGLALDAGLDPLGLAARHGGAEESAEALGDGLATRVAALRAEGFIGRLVEVDGRIAHDAGATAAQQIGWCLAGATFYLRALVAAGLDLRDAAALIGFTLSIDQRQFEMTAAIRALRRGWARVLEASGLAEPPPTRVHAATAWRMTAARDPHTNILRATIAAFAAVTGGADSLAVLPHTAALGLPDAAARRVARNVQVILQEESGLARVSDPAAGSGGFETLTDLTVRAGWAEFQSIESEGGLAGSLAAGAVQNRIHEAAENRIERARSGEEPVLGVTLYPLETEREHALRNVEPAAPSASRRSTAHGFTCQPLEPHRTSETLETAS